MKIPKELKNEPLYLKAVYIAGYYLRRAADIARSDSTWKLIGKAVWFCIAAFLALIAFSLYISIPYNLYQPVSSSNVAYGVTLTFLIIPIISCLLALGTRSNQKKLANMGNTWSALTDDFVFEQSANLNLLSLEYTILQGLTSGILWSLPPAYIYMAAADAKPFAPNLLLLAVPVSIIILIELRLIYEARASRIKNRQASTLFFESHTPFARTRAISADEES